MLIAVHGPNGRWQSETMHVHAANCPDRRKAHYRTAEGAVGSGHEWTFEASTARQIVEAIYDPECFDYNPDDDSERSAYDSDVRIFPCTGF